VSTAGKRKKTTPLPFVSCQRRRGNLGWTGLLGSWAGAGVGLRRSTRVRQVSLSLFLFFLFIFCFHFMLYFYLNSDLISILFCRFKIIWILIELDSTTCCIFVLFKQIFNIWLYWCFGEV
jgi:hypothetical protein